MKVMVDVFEIYTAYNDERGDWSDISSHTEGMLGVKSGTVTTLENLNKAIQNVGHPPLTKENFDSGAWVANEDDIGRFDYNYIGTSDGFPDKDGKYLYDISIWLYEIEPRPITQTELIQGLS
jgi:hypothetical protein